MEDKENIEPDNEAQRKALELGRKYSTMFAEAREIRKQIVEAQNKVSYTLSTYGWYISEMIPVTDVFKIHELFKSGKIDEADTLMANHYRKNYEQIIRRIISRHKDRKTLIEEASRAHLNQMYFASTILFISQADGICDGKIFVRSDKKLSSTEKDHTPDIVYETLGKQSAIDEDSRKTVSNYYSELNRHNVMHGLRIDYGTEINSLKALSLLSFVANFTNRFKDRH
jgi:hypothetical protein